MEQNIFEYLKEKGKKLSSKFKRTLVPFSSQSIDKSQLDPRWQNALLRTSCAIMATITLSTIAASQMKPVQADDFNDIAYSTDDTMPSQDQDIYFTTTSTTTTTKKPTSTTSKTTKKKTSTSTSSTTAIWWMI